MGFKVLVVCTGNICRSPVADQLLRARLEPSWPILVASAGTMAVVGADIDGPSALALREIGVEPRKHVARRVTAPMIAAADLVLTAETGHRSLVVRAEPMAFRRAFTLREFGRLGAELPPLVAVPPTEDKLRERVDQIAGHRGAVEAPQPGGDDIGDPYGAPLDVARACVAQISQSVDAVIRALGGSHVRAAS